MASIANVLAYDGASTPVLHTLNPVSVSRKGDEVVASYRETGLAVPTVAQPTLMVRLKRMKSGVWRCERRLEVPVMESILNQNAAGYTAAPKVAYVMTDIHVAYHHERSSVAERRLARQFGINISNAVTGSVAANTSGVMPDLIDLLVAPT
jgi:post-segregation antitoxin (ccd killing protein)